MTTAPTVTDQLASVQHGVQLAQDMLQRYPERADVRQQIFPLARELVYALLRICNTMRIRNGQNTMCLDPALTVLLRDTCRALGRLLTCLVDAEWALALVIPTTMLLMYAEEMVYLARRATAANPGQPHLALVKE